MGGASDDGLSRCARTDKDGLPVTRREIDGGSLAGRRALEFCLQESSKAKVLSVFVSIGAEIRELTRKKTRLYLHSSCQHAKFRQRPYKSRSRVEVPIRLESLLSRDGQQMVQMASESTLCACSSDRSHGEVPRTVTLPIEVRWIKFEHARMSYPAQTVNFRYSFLIRVKRRTVV